MVKPLYYCLILPVNLLAALCTDTIHSLKFVCIGSSVELFQNVTSTILEREYIFYKTFDDKSETIATWVMQNFSTKATIDPKYSHKVSLENGTILLQDFQAVDEGAYGMMIHQNSFITEKVKLCALVPPNMQCKPRIEFKDNHLNAFINETDCGRPAASVYWLGYNNQSVMTVEPGKEAGPYHACIHGPSLICARGNMATDYCSSFKRGADEDLQPKISLEKNNIQDSSITLQCPLNRNPRGNIRWRRNGILITNNTKYYQMEQNLTIRDVNIVDTYDTYTCLESGGRYESDLYSIESSGPYVIQVIPNITMVKEMDTLNVSCRTDCSPLCHVTWSRLDPLSSHTIVISQNDALQITNVTRNMSGNYTCKVQNRITGTSIEGSLSLNINYGPDTLVLNTSTNIIEVDGFGSITILCTAECFPPCVILWTEMNVNKQIEDAELKLINISANNTYTCHAWNPIIYTRSLARTINIAVKYDGPDEVVIHTSDNKTEVYQFSSTTVFCSADCFPPCMFRWTFSYTDTVIEGAILTLVNVTSNGSLTCHVTNPINLNVTISESIYIMEKSENVRHETSSVNKDQDGHVTFIDIPTIRYLLYVILVIGGIGAIVAVVTCMRKKYIPCTSIAQVSNNTMNAHSDAGESNQDESLSQHYWTIVTNVKGDLFTAVESDINVELRPFVDPAGNNILIYNRPEAYSYSFNSDPIDVETSCSDSTKSEGYINPIHSDPTEYNEYIDSRMSHSMECNAYIHPVPSDPLEPDAYTDSTPLGYKGGIISIDDPNYSLPGPHDQCNASACVDTMQRDTNIDDV